MRMNSMSGKLTEKIAFGHNYDWLYSTATGAKAIDRQVMTFIIDLDSEIDNGTYFSYEAERVPVRPVIY
jgi:hypothetical protein